MIALLLDATLWFKMAILLAVGAGVAVMAKRHRVPRRVAILSLLTLLYGVVIGIMAVGHLVAIGIKSVLGTLSPTLSWWAVPLGVALAIPAWWLVVNALRLRSLEGPVAKQTLLLHIGLGLLLLPLGPSAVLAVPAALNVAWQLSSKRAVEWFAMGMTTLAYVAMLVASFFVGAGG
jgi:hypothetical protein